MNNTTDFIADILTKQDNGILPDISMYGTLIWAPLGLILNTLSLVILIQSKTFLTSMGNYLKSLCVADNILLIGFFCISADEHWQNNLNFPQISHLNYVTCKFSICTVTVGLLSTGLILASATMERFLVVAFPLKFRSSNSDIISKGLICSYFIFSFAVSIPFGIGAGITAGGQCWSKEEYEKMIIKADLVAHVITSNGLCGGVILIFTIAIIIILFQQRRKRNELTNSSSNSQKEFKITVMLATVTCLFLILRLPDMIVVQISLVDPEIKTKVESWSMFFMLLTIINHSINFFIYFIFLETFRETFFKMFLKLFCFSQRTQTTRGAEIEFSTQSLSVNTSGNSLVTIDTGNQPV